MFTASAATTADSVNLFQPGRFSRQPRHRRQSSPIFRNMSRIIADMLSQIQARHRAAD
jgi:hypothetical protein